MTTEMGESLCYSWLKHIKGCQLVQTNWKASLSWDHEEIDPIILEDVQKIIKDKSNQTSDSIFKQTECDVIGIQADKTKPKLFAVEVAFHRSGLNYGNDVKKVLLKSIRIVLCLRVCFRKDIPIEFFFACPKISGQKKDGISDGFEKLNLNSNILGGNVKFTLLAEDDFNNRILKPLMIRLDGIADTSELFVRSCQLLDLMAIDLDKTIDEKYLNEIEPISNIVRSMMVPIIKMLPKTKIKSLTKTKFSSMHKPILSQTRDTEEEKKRYYSSPIKTKEGDYYLTNHWVDNNKQELIEWIINNQQYFK